MSDPVNPDHYKGSIECIDAIAEAVKDLKGMDAICTGNAIKYLWRWHKNGGVVDLKKAMWYIDRIVKDKEKKLDDIARKLHDVLTAAGKHEGSKLQERTGGTASTSTRSSEGIQPDGTSKGTDEHSSA